MSEIRVVNSKKRIGIVANSTWNIFNFRLNILKYLIDSEFQVFVLAPVDEYIEYKEKFPHVKHIGIKNLDRNSLHVIKNAKLIIELAYLYKRLNLQVVLHYTHKPNIFGGIAARIQRIPSVAVVTGLGYSFIHKGWLQSIIKTLYKLTKGYHQMIIFENEADRLLFEKKKLADPERAISVKGCGLNLDYYKPCSNGIPSSGMTFTFIGRLLYDKGLREFVEAARLVHHSYPDVNFWIAGDFDDKNPAHIDKTEFTGWVEEPYITYQGFQQDVRSIIKHSDCIVLPSYREAIPRSVTEAMAMAKPVIATNTAGCIEAVEHEHNGLLVPIQDVKALSEAMIRMYELDPVERRKMGSNGRTKAIEEFDENVIAQQFVEVIQKITSSLD